MLHRLNAFFFILTPKSQNQDGSSEHFLLEGDIVILPD